MLLLVSTRRQLRGPVFKVCVYLVGAGTNLCVEIGQMNIRRSAYRHLSNPAPNAWPMTQHGLCGAVRIEIDPMGWKSPKPASANSRVFGGITDKVRIQPLSSVNAMMRIDFEEIPPKADGLSLVSARKAMRMEHEVHAALPSPMLDTRT